MYVALIYMPILTWDFLLSINLDSEHSGLEIFNPEIVTVGSVVLLINVLMLSGYTFGCHAFRHVVGGGANKWTGRPMNRIKYIMWRVSTYLNENHKDWALYSLFWVMFTDFYIRACTDPLFGWTDMILWGGP